MPEEVYGLFLILITNTVTNFQVSSSLSLHNITVNVKLDDAQGGVAAFADFNSDKATDILILNSTGVIQNLYTWTSGSGQFEFVPLGFPYPAAAARAADFDGDGMLDLVWQEASKSSCSPVYISWLNWDQEKDLIASAHMFLYNASTVHAPIMAVDVDGDHISDIVSATCESPHLPRVWISTGKNHSFVSHDLKGVAEMGREVGAGVISGFNYMDLSGDCVPELLVFRSDKGGVIDMWRWQEDQLVWTQNVSLNVTTAIRLSPVTTVDLSGDGITELVLFACYEADHSVCLNTSLIVMFPAKYPGTDVTNCRGSSSWKLTFEKVQKLYLSHDGDVPVAIPLVTVSAQPVLGDLDLDSSLDILLPVIDKLSNETFLLHVSGSSDGSFSPKWRSMRDYSVAGAVAVNFFDFYEDGVLDVLVRVKNGGNEDDGSCTLSAFRQSVGEDHTFLKVLVLEGFCYSSCSGLILPYGSVRSGAAVSYLTTGRSGHAQTTVAAVKSSSAALQLPFILFGLGETPNFIERLTVGMVVNTTSGTGTGVEVRFRTWKNLVPNSQVIVIPTPPYRPSSWHLSLYLTPSHLVYTTIGVLCALGAGLALLIALLHGREKYQDSQERKQAKHKFHFNAM